MIGYNRESFNCAHWAIRGINSIHGTNILFCDNDAWQASFIPFLRKFFNPVNNPSKNCLVVMHQKSGGMHLGVFVDWQVHHNYNAGYSGCVTISDIGTIRSMYKKVRFYEVNKKVFK